MRRPIVNFLPLVLGVSLNSTPDGVYPPKHWNYQDFSKGKFELNPWQGSFGCLVLMLVLVQKRQSYKSTVKAGDADGIYQSDPQTSCWPASLGRLASAWKN